MSIRDTLIEDFSALTIRSPRPMTVVDATMLYAVARFDEVRQSHRLEEEAITAALCGAISSAFPFCAEYVGCESDQEATCYWAQFKKSKPSKERPQDHEAVSGADFALVLCVGEDDYRVAMFQAKLEDGDGIIDVFQRAPKPKDAETPQRNPQIVTLVKRGLEVLGVETGYPATRMRRLGWIHYLCYSPETMHCIPLSRLRDAYARDVACDKTKHTTNRVQRLSSDPSFKTVLRNALALPASIPGSPKPPMAAKGWLQMTRAHAKAWLPELMALTEVYFIDEEKGGSAVCNDLPGQENAAIVRKRASAKSEHKTERSKKSSNRPR